MEKTPLELQLFIIEHLDALDIFHLELVRRCLAFYSRGFLRSKFCEDLQTLPESHLNFCSYCMASMSAPALRSERPVFAFFPRGQTSYRA